MVAKHEKEMKALLDKYEKLSSDHSSLTESKRHLENEYKEY
jgi:hypothetical protein